MTKFALVPSPFKNAPMFAYVGFYDDLLAVLKSLRPRDQFIFKCRYFLEMTFKEIAAKASQKYYHCNSPDLIRRKLRKLVIRMSRHPLFSDYVRVTN